MRNLITTSAAAAIIGITTGRLRQLIRAKEIPFVDMGPRAKMIPKNVAEKFRDNRPKTGRPRSVNRSA